MYKSTMYAASCAVSVTLAVVYPATADDWVKDPLTGCELFMQDNKANEKYPGPVHVQMAKRAVMVSSSS